MLARGTIHQMGNTLFAQPRRRRLLIPLDKQPRHGQQMWLNRTQCWNMEALQSRRLARAPYANILLAGHLPVPPTALPATKAPGLAVRPPSQELGCATSRLRARGTASSTSGKLDVFITGQPQPGPIVGGYGVVCCKPWLSIRPKL